ncbi:MAG: hypothetical protein Q7R41_16420 [Phycisphaerales bacterium]|nr:hypothetical protein [Phycisphaerales bacterium]
MPKLQCVCGAKYRFADSAVGKKAKCKRCGAVFTLEADDGPIPIADDPPDVSDSPLTDRPRVSGPSPFPPSPPNVDSLTPARGYGESILWTIFFPSSIRNLLTFFAIWIGLTVGWMLPWFGSIFVTLWYAAFRFAVIESAAAGDKSLPEVGFSRDDLFDAFSDALRWLGSWAIALAPALIYFILEAGSGAGSAQQTVTALAGGIAGLLPGSGADPTFVTLLAAGLFMWPIMVLVITLGGFECLYRVDLLFITIVRSFPAYLVTLALVFGATAVEEVLNNAVSAGAATGTGGGIGTAIGGYLAAYALSVGITLYCNIVMLRAIGLYYHHFKHKFAWDWG